MGLLVNGYPKEVCIPSWNAQPALVSCHFYLLNYNLCLCCITYESSSFFFILPEPDILFYPQLVSPLPDFYPALAPRVPHPPAGTRYPEANAYLESFHELWPCVNIVRLWPNKVWFKPNEIILWPNKQMLRPNKHRL